MWELALAAGDAMSNEPNQAGGWDRVASELRAYRELQRKAWGETDNALLGRYLAGEADAGERQKVEAALEQHPELRQLTELVREVLGECDPTVAREPEKQPDILPFAPPKVSPKRAAFRPGRRLAWLAAACLLVAIGLPLAAWRWLGNGRETQELGQFVVDYYPPGDPDKTPAKPLFQVADRTPEGKGGSPARDAGSRGADEFRTWLDRGQAEMDKQRFEAAALAFNRAAAVIETDEKKADNNPALTVSGVAPGAPQAAPQEQAARARQLANYSLNMHNGETALKAARYDDAVKCYSEALRCQPDDRLANLQVQRAKELAALQVALKAETAAAPHRLEDAVNNLHPFAANLMKGVRKLSEKGGSAKKKAQK
jgi:tetratricopeptide (TPR) repeat protein